MSAPPIEDVSTQLKRRIVEWTWNDAVSEYFWRLLVVAFAAGVGFLFACFVGLFAGLINVGC